VVDDPLGGFEFTIQFDRQGTRLLEQYSTASKGKRIAVFSYFGNPKEPGKGEVRWLAAPVVRERITDGIFTFTPDASREEAERIARGLNNVARVKEKDNP
jgi:preprotein translocase subunit SecD